jgi:hypothetical protein
MMMAEKLGRADIDSISSSSYTFPLFRFMLFSFPLCNLSDVLFRGALVVRLFYFAFVSGNCRLEEFISFILVQRESS